MGLGAGQIGVFHMEAIMQESIRAGSQAETRLSNPILDLAIAVLETQLKAWHAYQVEGTRFIAKRMRGNLEHLRALGHCCDIESTAECHRAWLHNIQKDYTEEWGRLTATSYALGFGELSSLGSLYGQPQTKEATERPPTPQSTEKAKPKPGFQAAA
jgi:hypothetical protein